MNNGEINYQEILNESLIDVLRKILTKVQREGLSGEHQLYISFITNHVAVKLSHKIKQRYPKEITIVLQNQFEILSINLQNFSVKISFGGVPEIVEIPFDSIISFSDPSVDFNLVFQNQTLFDDLKSDLTPKLDAIIESKNIKINLVDNHSSSESNNVIVLDKFRNKNKPR